MKKLIAILLALAAILSFAACGSSSDSDEATTTTTEAVAQLSGTLEEIASQVLSKTTAIEMALDDPKELDLADLDTVNYYLGVSSADSIERVVYSDPLIGSIPFSMCLVTAKDGADIDALKNEILEGVNYRKWVCVAAEKVLVSNCGNTILMIMSTEEIVDDVYSAFSAVASNNASEPLTKAGEVSEEPPVEDGAADMDVPADMPAADGDMPAADGEVPAYDGVVLA